ncbi:MAG: rhomboid family intramembrane serine protease [Phycisphaeraceae bacterium]
MADQAPDPTPAEEEDPLPTLGQSVVVRWLIGLNLIIHALNALFPAEARDPKTGEVVLDSATGEPVQVQLLTYLGNFNVIQGINGYEFWRLFTYQFLHGGVFHLLMNMMALYVFGPMIEKWWGPKRFIAFYLLCGACGAWLMALLAFFPSLVNAQSAWLVGASGSIFGVLVAVAMIYPKVEVKLIIPPMWVTARKLAIVFIVLSFVSMFVGYNLGGNAAHIGGALFGYLLVRRPWSLDFADPDAPKLDPPGKAEPDAADLGNKPGA